MTRPSEKLTFEFDGEEGVWAPAGEVPFIVDTVRPVTPLDFRTWFNEQVPRRRNFLGRLVAGPTLAPISTALNGPKVRYEIREDGFVYRHWVAFSLLDEERLRAMQLPVGASLEKRKGHLRMCLEDLEPLQLGGPVGLVRCDHGSGAHWYAGGKWREWGAPMKAERVVEVLLGTDGNPGV